MNYPDGWFWTGYRESKYDNGNYYQITAKVYNKIGGLIEEKVGSTTAYITDEDLYKFTGLDRLKRRYGFPTSYVEENLKKEAPQIDGYVLEKVLWNVFSSSYSSFSQYSLYQFQKTEKKPFGFLVAYSDTYYHHFINGLVKSVYTKVYDPSVMIDDNTSPKLLKESRYSYIYKNNLKPTDCCIKKLCKPKEYFLI